ncbi:hypothetical protein MNBD_GAMMA10-1063 [hydrothermal vent metagenome]|uniref:Uncharacterized protein n=1 Tax=hydrothermal vent metagenome TaxID=652676 RepID=A0A3B0XVQ5_9ZZZZ
MLERNKNIKRNTNGWPLESLPSIENCSFLASGIKFYDYIDEMKELSISFIHFDTKEAEDSFYRSLDRKRGEFYSNLLETWTPSEKEELKRSLSSYTGYDFLIYGAKDYFGL